MKSHYPFSVGDRALSLDFKFESSGPKGTIEKVARYELQNRVTTFFELTLADWNSETMELDFSTISDNKDRDKILATVAATVVEFTKKFPDLAIVTTGNTPSKTRLYQMMISKNLEEIKTIFDVYGLLEGTWKPFKKTIKYDAFAVRRKMESA